MSGNEVMRGRSSADRGHDPDPLAVLSAAPPVVGVEEVEGILASRYGLVGQATPLSSERDQNFMIRAEGGVAYVFKINNEVQDPGIAAFQTEALRHLAAVAPTLPVPNVIGATNGDFDLRWSSQDGVPRLSRLVTFREGSPMAKHPRSDRQIAAFGRLAAEVGRGLRGFFHPAAGHQLLWDLKQAARVHDLLHLIESVDEREQVAAVIERFERHARPRLPALRGQVIHCDLNPSNVLVDPATPDTMAGIIDFGDMVHGALVNDVAIAAAYLLGQETDPLAQVCCFVAAYHGVTPLERDELTVLPHLIATRIALTLAITAWRAARYPDNRDYILRNRGSAVAGLRALTTLAPTMAEARLARACGLD